MTRYPAKINGLPAQLKQFIMSVNRTIRSSLPNKWFGLARCRYGPNEK